MSDSELVKLYYRIGEASSIVGVAPHVLRYWEQEFRTIRPQKSATGQRVYSRADIERLLKVKELLREQGFTIAGARKRLREQSAQQRDAGGRTATQRARSMRLALQSLREEILALLDELHQAGDQDRRTRDNSSSGPVQSPRTR